jgi:PAS domain S-box-containing protein
MAKYDDRVRAEQVRVFYSQTGMAVVGGLLAALMLCVVQWNAVDGFRIAVWMSYTFAVTAARGLLYVVFRRLNPPDENIGPWRRWYIILLFLGGCGWGAACFLLFPEDSRLQAAVMTLWMLGVSAGGGIGGYMVHLPALLAFFVPVILPCVVRLFMVGTSFHQLIGGALIVYSMVALSASRRLNRFMVKAIQDNLELEKEISERAKVQRIAAEGHHHLKLITDNIPACIAHVDAEELRYQFVNQRHLKNFGLREEEIVGSRVADILGPEKFAFARPYIDKALSGEPASYINQFILQGEPRWVNVNYVPSVDESGRVRGIVVLTHDITESKRAEEALRRSEEEHKELYKEANEARELYRSLLESTPDSIVMYDMDGKVTFVNDAFVRTFGWTLEELADGVPYTPESEREITSRNVTRVVREGSPISHFETRRLTKTGNVVNVSISASRFYDHLGEPSGMLVILRDIDARVRMEAQLVEAKEAAEAANRAKSEFLANMSHEIRTPMNAIIGLSHLVLQTVLTPVQLDYQVKIQDSADSLLRLIDDILDLSKVEAGKLEIEGRGFSLQEVTEGVSSVIYSKAGEKGLDFSLEVDDSVPAYLRGDALRLRQVLINLASNAVKFTHEGGVSIRIDLTGQSDNELVLRFAVRDSGIGMTPSQVEELFTPFYQADATITRKYGGSGLGLAISKRLVEMMGGEITVQSEPGVGSEFTFTARFGEFAEEIHEQATGISAETAIGLLAGSRVLLVEDNEINRQVARELLEAVGVAVVEALDGHSAVELAGAEEFQAVLIDLQMPVMDGLAAAREIRADPDQSDLPIIAMTANAMASDREKCLAAGMDDYLPKPIKPNLLYETLIRWIHPEAYKAKAAASEGSEMEPKPGLAAGLPELDGVDMRIGLAHVNQDLKLYFKVLENTYKGYRNTSSAIRAEIDHEDWDSAHRLVHSFKGVVGTIGAGELSCRALDLEKALKSSERDCIEAVYEVFRKEAERVMAALRSLFDQKRWPPSGEEQGKPREIEDLESSVAEFKRLVEEGDPEAAAWITPIESRMGPSAPKDLFRRLESQIDDYEFEEALATLEKIMGGIKNAF